MGRDGYNLQTSKITAWAHVYFWMLCVKQRGLKQSRLGLKIARLNVEIGEALKMARHLYWKVILTKNCDRFINLHGLRDIACPCLTTTRD